MNKRLFFIVWDWSYLLIFIKDEGIMQKKRNFIFLLFILSLLLMFGCNSSGVIGAASSALDQTLGNAQSRYGGSKYYDENKGDEIDRLSGYRRIRGKAHYYNKSGSTIHIDLVGDLSPNETATEKWSANYCGEVVNKETGSTMYEVCHGPDFSGRIIVLRADDYEVR